jgi:hypothetical protein
MASARRLKVGPRALLAGDGGLLMVAAFAVLGPLNSLLQAGAIFLIIVGLLAPLLAWRLHGRHVDRPATEGALLGYLAGAGLLLVLLGLIALLIVLPLHLLGLSGTEWITAAAVIVAYLAVAARLDVDALRDLSPRRREHAWLDAARLVATVAGVAYILGAIVWATGHPEWDYTGAFLSLGGCGVVGAAVVTVADWMVRRHEQRSHRHHGHLVSGA